MQVLEVKPEKRLSSARALEHEWLGGYAVAEGIRAASRAVVNACEEQRATEVVRRVELIMRTGGSSASMPHEEPLP